jgi:ribosomal protein S25
MEKQPENVSAAVELPVDYEEKAKQQETLMKKVAEAHDKTSSVGSALELDRETDLLRHYVNAQKESPKERAQTVAVLAKRIAVNRAVSQLPVSDN